MGLLMQCRTFRFLFSILLLAGLAFMQVSQLQAAPIVELLDPVELQKLEVDLGYALASLLDLEKPGASPLAPHSRWLSSSVRYASVWSSPRKTEHFQFVEFAFLNSAVDIILSPLWG